VRERVCVGGRLLRITQQLRTRLEQSIDNVPTAAHFPSVYWRDVSYWTQKSEWGETRCSQI